MQLTETFDAAALPQSNSGIYDPLPPGWYSATITQAELRPTKDGSGEYIRARYDIVGPTHQGRVVFGNFNIKNASAKAEEIGRAQLGDVMRAIGLARLTDTDQLIGGNLSIKLDIRPATEQYAAQNEVRGFRAISASAPAQSASHQPPPGPKPSAPPAKAAPPWAKK